MINMKETIDDCPTLIHVPHASVLIPEEYLADYCEKVIDRELLLMRLVLR